MNSRRNETSSPAKPFAASERNCTNCGGTLLPAGYGLVDRSGCIMEVACRSCGRRSTIRSGDYASAPRNLGVRHFFGENLIEVIR
jgi:hypothetical protein